MKKFIYAISILIFSHCANPVGPTGGDKDTKAPVLVKTKITNENNLKKITLVFDENINTKGSILLSPITTKKNIEINKHRNTIWFSVPKETNSISLGDVITDVNENNLGRYPFIILGSDSHKYVFNYKSSNPTKDKIKSYSYIDSFFYYGDNTKKGKIGLEGLKKQSQYIYTFNDLNNNDKYDINEDYYIQRIEENQLLNSSDSIKDTTSVIIYPSRLKEIKKSHFTKEGISIYTQVPKYFIQKEKKKENLYLIEHSDSIIINTADSSYLENLIRTYYSDAKFIEAKIEIKPSKKYETKIGLFEKDTIIYLEFNLGQYLEKIQKKEIVIQNKSELDQIKKNASNNSIYKGSEIEKIQYNIKNQILSNLNNPLKKDSVLKKIKIKLGKITIKNNNKNESLKILIISEGKIIFIENLKNYNNDYYLPAGNYKYIIWQDINDNGEVDTKNTINTFIERNEAIQYEPIIVYMKETSVNSKLDNIIIVE